MFVHLSEEMVNRRSVTEEFFIVTKLPLFSTSPLWYFLIGFVAF